MKIRKGDTVLITSGKDRIRKGKVLRTFPKRESVLIEGINLKKKHVIHKRKDEKTSVYQNSYVANHKNTGSGENSRVKISSWR